MNKETISNSWRKIRFLLLFFLFLRAQKRAASVDLLCWTGASACHCLFSAFNPAFKSQSISAMDRLKQDACTSCPFWLDLLEIAQWLATLYRRLALICKPRSAIGRQWVFSFFFFLLSIAQRFGCKPPPSHMKVLSFVRDVWTFEMTPYYLTFTSLFSIKAMQVFSVFLVRVRHETLCGRAEKTNKTPEINIASFTP